MAWKLLGSTPKQRKRKPSRLLKWNRFKKNEEGTAAIEFAFLAMPFFFITFAILDTAIGFFADRILETSVNTLARDIRIGKIIASSYDDPGVEDPANFREELCRVPTMAFFDCSKLVVDVRAVNNFEAPTAPQYDANGNLQVSNFDFAPGAGGTINIITVYYDWPRLFNFTGFGVDQQIGEKWLMRSVTAFMNEPYT